MNAVYMGVEDKMMIFFDIDNTLVDYSKSEREAIRLITDKYGLKLEQCGKCWKGISERYFTKYLRQEMSFQEQGAQRIRKLFNLQSLKEYCGKENFVYVGDNLQTDIYPCLELGIRAIWINREGRSAPKGVTEIRSLEELNVSKKGLSKVNDLEGKICFKTGMPS